MKRESFNFIWFAFFCMIFGSLLEASSILLPNFASKCGELFGISFLLFSFIVIDSKIMLSLFGCKVGSKIGLLRLIVYFVFGCILILISKMHAVNLCDALRMVFRGWGAASVILVAYKLYAFATYKKQENDDNNHQDKNDDEEDR